MVLTGVLATLPCLGGATPPSVSPQGKEEAKHLDRLPAMTPHGVHVDRSGRKERGKASVYAHHFVNRKMANGRRLNPNSNVAASKSLPLGTVAEVTNLENGRKSTVRVEDRGPYVDGRIVDLTPKVAGQLGLKEPSVTPVEVRPITVPQLDGAVKLGAGAADASPQEVRQAMEVTKALAGLKVTETAKR